MSAKIHFFLNADGFCSVCRKRGRFRYREIEKLFNQKKCIFAIPFYRTKYRCNRLIVK